MSCISTIAPGRNSRITFRATDFAVGCSRSSPDVADHSTCTIPSERTAASVPPLCNSYGGRKSRGFHPRSCDVSYCARNSSARTSHAGRRVRRGCDQV